MVENDQFWGPLILLYYTDFKYIFSVEEILYYEVLLTFYQRKIDIGVLLSFISIFETFISSFVSSFSFYAVLILIINSYRKLSLSRITSIFRQVEV